MLPKQHKIANAFVLVAVVLTLFAVTFLFFRLQRDIRREWFHQLKLKRQQADQPKPWQRKLKKKQRKKQGEW